MNEKPHVLHVGLSPWDLGAIDFANYRNTVILDESKAGQIDEGTILRFAGFKTFAASTAVDQDVYDNAFSKIQAVAEELVNEHGVPHGIVGLYEHVTLPAARLREIYGVPGTSVRTATLCRDKIEMKNELKKTSIPFPRFMEYRPGIESAALKAFLAELNGKKIVAKPCSQAGSQGVHVFETPDVCWEWMNSAAVTERYDIEEFIEGDIYHFDGLVRNGRMHIFSGSQCLGSCFDFMYRERPFGAVTIDDEQLLAEAKDFTASILDAFGLSDSAFHLEAIRSKDCGFVFLEIGNRFGGAGIPKVFSKVYGIDLPKEAFLADVGAEPATRTAKTILDYEQIGAAAYLWMPLARKERARARSILGLENLPESVFHAEIPQIGQWFNEGPAFFPNSGRFFFKGESTSQVIADAQQVMRNYSVRLETPEEWPA